MADRIVSLSAKADNDLREIIRYIAEHSGDMHAQSVRIRILKELALLAARPRIGSRTSDLEPGARCFSLPPWKIFYDPMATGIEVARIIDSRRDLVALFSRKP